MENQIRLGKVIPTKLSYAQIDLKNTTIKIKDGYTGPGGQGLVNNAAGYTASTTTMTVDGFVGAVVTGDIFRVNTDGTLTDYTITAHTETLGNTTSITFTPGLAESVADNDQVNIQPHRLEIKIGEGTFSYSEKRKVEYVLDRGKLDTVRLADEEPIDIRFDFIWEFLKADTGEPPSIEDALKKRGNASTWVTSAADTCEPYAVDLEIINDPPCVADKSEQILLQDFRWEELNHDANTGQVSVTGRCNVLEATINRATTF